MARFNNGLLTDFTGRIGPITAYQRFGKTIGRISKSDVKFKTTPLRAIQQQKMAVVTRFTRAFSGTGFLQISFPAYAGTGSGYNRMTSLLLNQAVEGSYPDIHLNYAQVLVSKGKLPGAVEAAIDAVVQVETQHLLQMHFGNNSHTGTASPQDRVILVAYAETFGRAIFSLDAGRRGDGLASLDVTALQRHTVETWIGFVNPGSSNVSDSVYLGRVQV